MGERQLVLVGGGHAHALVLRTWAQHGRPRARIVLVSPEAHSPYSGMLPGHVAGHYGWGEMHVDLARLAARAGVERIEDRVVGLDLARRRAMLERGQALAFDLLSLDTGSTSGLPGLEAAVPVKPLGPFLQRWSAFVAAPRGEVRVVGGGLGGIELALAMAHRLAGQVPVTLVERGERIAPTLAPHVQAKLAAVLAAAGVTVRTRTSAETLDAAAGFTVAAAGARPAPWLAAAGLGLDPAGFVRVDAHLRSVTHPAVFAAGDVAHMDASPREKAGVFAVRQGPVLARILAAGVDGEPLPDFRPQTDYLRLISLGRKRALAVKYGRAVGGTGPLGALLWRWKDRIDRGFMAAVGTAADRAPSDA